MKGHFYLALTDDPMVDVITEQGSMEEVGEDVMERMTTPSIFQQLGALGIDRARLAKAMDSSDAWGKLVHSFEYVTALSVLLDNWPEDENRLELVESAPTETGKFPMHEGGR